MEITPEQQSSIADIAKRAALLGILKEDAEEIIKYPDLLQEVFTADLKKLVRVNKRFGAPIKEFWLTVPSDYNKNAKAASKLKPGKKYKVEIIPVLKSSTYDDCQLLLKKRKAIRVGEEGMTLVKDLKLQEIPIGIRMIFFDETENLPHDEAGNCRVACMHRHPAQGLELYHAFVHLEFNCQYCLVYFCDEE